MPKNNNSFVEMYQIRMQVRLMEEEVVVQFNSGSEKWYCKVIAKIKI